jgi:hypothetical protein
MRSLKEYVIGHMNGGAERRSARTAATPPSGDGPIITRYGQIALDIINAVQAEHPITALPGKLSPALGDSPRIRIGYLSDPESATTLILENSRSSSTVRETTITFGTAILIELLSQVAPGKKAEAEGDGTYYTDSRWKMPNADDGRATSSNRGPLILGMVLSEDSKSVTLTYTSESASGKIEFKPAAASRR